MAIRPTTPSRARIRAGSLRGVASLRTPCRTESPGSAEREPLAYHGAPNPLRDGIRVPLGLILHPSYRVREGRPVVRLVGRLEHDVAFLVEDDRFRPYFFVRASEAHHAAGERDVEIHATSLRNLAGEAMTQIGMQVPNTVPALRDRLAKLGAGPCEADIRFPYRYLIDHGIRAAVCIEGEPKRRDTLLYFRNPELRAGSERPALSSLSLDLETTLASPIQLDARRRRVYVLGRERHPDHAHGGAIQGDPASHADPRSRRQTPRPPQPTRPTLRTSLPDACTAGAADVNEAVIALPATAAAPGPAEAAHGVRSV